MDQPTSLISGHRYLPASGRGVGFGSRCFDDGFHFTANGLTNQKAKGRKKPAGRGRSQGYKRINSSLTEPRVYRVDLLSLSIPIPGREKRRKSPAPGLGTPENEGRLHGEPQYVWRKPPSPEVRYTDNLGASRRVFGAVLHPFNVATKQFVATLKRFIATLKRLSGTLSRFSVAMKHLSVAPSCFNVSNNFSVLR